jgi:glycosyltransferase involved in cell wall biosynthesis
MLRSETDQKSNWGHSSGSNQIPGPEEKGSAFSAPEHLDKFLSLEQLRLVRPPETQESPVIPPVAHAVVAVVIPCYKVSSFILKVLSGIGSEVAFIVVVDDACPERTADLVEEKSKDSRISIVRLGHNVGVGGAVLEGYRESIKSGATIIVKVDGDGQMDPALIPLFIAPIVSGEADYTKGNRFNTWDSLRGMPFFRLVGHSVLSLLSKLSSGYWGVMDPTNGYTAISSQTAAGLLKLNIAHRYFFESDVLCHLARLQAVVRDVPMASRYGDEKSNLRIMRVLVEFPFQHAARFAQRIFYSYVMSPNAGSLQFASGLGFLVSGFVSGVSRWADYSQLGTPAPADSVLPVTAQLIFGVLCLLSWIAYDMNRNSTEPIPSRLKGKKGRSSTSIPVA